MKNKSKGKWNQTTLWMLIDNSWECAENMRDFNARRNHARALEKRTSYWNDNVYLNTVTETVPLPSKEKKCTKTNSKQK